jgi:potassium/sodium efflux P-type ATPase
VGLKPEAALILAVGIIVAAIPEGLPATTTLAYAMAAQRLAQRGVLVKKLAVLETLGTVTVVCTDKSGTLTQNQMTVRKIWVDGKELDVTGIGYDPKGEIRANSSKKSRPADLDTLLAAASLCNNSRLLPPTAERRYWSSLGDQTEAALHTVALKGDVREEAVSKRYPRVHELPFDARRKRMTTVHAIRDAGNPSGFVAYVKGAPREVLQYCTQILLNGEIRPLEDEEREKIISANDRFARGVLRVLAFAQRTFPANTPPGAMHSVERVERDLTFIGLIAMMDPPREEVLEAVQTCRRAGIRMVMITGDYGLTAESLARRIGMVQDPHPLIVTGADLDEMDDHQLDTILEKEVIFARMAPEHKMRLVSAYQARGEVVAVTGDGVNDAPALRKADVGVAMGVAGTDVSREAADIILISDNFAAITTAIEEGRAVFDNLRKFITYIFSSNVPEIVPFMLTAMFQFPLAMTVRQILAIDLGTDLFPALALSVEKPEPDVMLRPPRHRDKPLITRSVLLRAFLWLGLIETILCYIGFFLVYDNGMNWARDIFPVLERLPRVPPESNYALAFTIFYAGVVIAQVGNAFACRTERNRGSRLGWLSNSYLLWAIVIELAILFLFIYFPPLANILGHVPIPTEYWILLVLYAPILYTLEWIRKWVVRLQDRNKLAG